MEINPGTLEQVGRLRDGRQVLIEDDVGGFAATLRAIDSSLRLRLSEQTGVFVVYQLVGHRERLVTTAQELDGRLVRHVAALVHQYRNGRYDYAAELERADREADRRREHEFSEEQGPIAERLHHAIRKDMGWTGDKAFIPKGVADGEHLS